MSSCATPSSSRRCQDLDLGLDRRIDPKGSGSRRAGSRRATSARASSPSPRSGSSRGTAPAAASSEVYADSRNSAIPCPPPMQADRCCGAHPAASFRTGGGGDPRSGGGQRVTTAMAPPSTLVDRAAGPVLLHRQVLGRECLVHLEEIKVASAWPHDAPARAGSLARPMPMLDGSQPAMPQPNELRERLQPFSARRTDGVASTSAPAPSQMPLAAPRVDHAVLL